MRSYVCRILLIAALAALAIPSAHAQPAKRAKPNILLIVADDLGYGDIGAHGGKAVPTPNIDKLARSGVRFGAAYCSNPVCTPSRASLLTSLYTHHHQAWNNTTPWPFERKTVAHYFGRAGYMRLSLTIPRSDLERSLSGFQRAILSRTAIPA